MKTPVLFFFSTVIFFACLLSTDVYSQSESDPFLGNYIFGNSAEVYLANRVGNYLNANLYDYNSVDGITREKLQEWGASDRDFDVCSGDFNNDGYDEAIQAIVQSATERWVALQVSGNWSIFNVGKVETYPCNVRLASGDFDGDANKEFVLAYKETATRIRISLYETDSLNNIIEVASSPHMEYLDDLGSEGIFDIAAGDFDGDGRDEIALVKNLDNIAEREKAIISLQTMAFDFNEEDKIFEERDELKIDRTHEYTWVDPQPINYYRTYVRRLSQLSIAAGDLIDGGPDEIVIGYSVLRAYKYLVWPSPAKKKLMSKSYMLYLGISEPGAEFSLTDVLNPSCWDKPRQDSKEHSWSSEDDYYTHGVDFPFTLACADFNGDGQDEIVSSGGNEVHIFSIPSGAPGGSVSEIEGCVSIPFNPVRWSFNVSRQFVISDLDADTSSFSSDWRPEITLMSCSVPFLDQGWGTNSPVELQIWGVDENANGLSFVEKSSLEKIPFYLSAGYSMAAGDFDGDALRFRRPRSYIREGILQPIVVLNSPPVHFDVFEGSSYDICNIYNRDPGDVSFFSEYAMNSESEVAITTKYNRDWGISGSLKISAEAAGNGIEATLTGKYGDKFSEVDDQREGFIITENKSARRQDIIYARLTDYQCWEYPVYYRGKLLGHVLVVEPLEGTGHASGKWYSNEEWRHWSHWPTHEVGNLLSYQYYEDLKDNPDISAADASFFMSANNYTINKNTGNDKWSLSHTSFDGNETTTERSFGFGADLTAKAGYEASVFGHKIDMGVELNTKGNYDQSDINTIKTTVQEGWTVSVNYANLNAELEGTGYNFTPYVYWSQNGALVVDYSVQPNTAGPGEDPTWWDTHYGSLPDLAFILPWRYNPQKGLGEEAIHHQTTDIIFSPPDPLPGDTVTILARVHNFSLAELPHDNISLAYYLGDPDAGGVPLSGIYDQEQSIAYDITRPRGETYIKSMWKVPADIPADPHIYALIDPGDDIEEIHEHNNKGYIIIPIESTVGIDEPGYNTFLKEYTLDQNYPNPVNQSTVIAYHLPVFDHVDLSIYNVLGQRVATLVSEEQPMGTYKVEWDASGFSSGIYFYRLETDKGFAQTKKLILVTY